MNLKRHLKTPLLTLAAIGLLASACSGGGSETSDLAGQIFEMPTQADVEANEHVRFEQSQALVADCMIRAGHEYVIPDASRVLQVSGGGFVEPEAETAADIGYGISLAFDDESNAEEVEYVDPNELYLQSISESERGAWQAAFQGDEIVRGCATAGDSAFQQLTRNDELLAKYSDQLQAVYDRAAADPLVIEANASWVTCMQQQGFYDYEHPEDAVYDVQERFTALSGTEDAEAQAQLEKFERELATADAQCPFNNFGGWERTMEDMYAHYEQEFVNENSAEILAYLAAQDA